jgi:hypothetical protein
MFKPEPDRSRRILLTRALPVVTLGCFSCRSLFAQQPEGGVKQQLPDNLAMTTEDTYALFYGTFIPLLQAMLSEMGREKGLTLLEKTASESAAQLVASAAKDLPRRDLKAFGAFLGEALASPPYDKALAYRVVGQTDNVLELRYSKCLPAKLLRAMNAADIGLAIECSGAAALARAFNPKIQAANPKNLMKGDSVCIERFTLAA